jgi:hypothetical protein
MQFAVPQFTDVEDKLIGSLTLKQFLVLLGTGGIVLFFWSVLGPNLIFFILALPISIAGVASALGKYNGRPMFTYLVPFAAYLSSNRLMIFKREPQTISVSKSQIKQDKAEAKVDPELLEPAESRLKKLAYMLDRKNEEEKAIISKDDLYIVKEASTPKIDLGQVMTRAKADIMATARKLDASAGSLTGKKPASSASAPKSKKKFDPSDILK